MMKMSADEPGKPTEPQGNPWMNLVKIIFLVAVLVGAWFVLERLIGGK